MFWVIFWLVWILIGFTSGIGYFKIESGVVTIGDILISILFSWLGVMMFLMMLDEVFEISAKIGQKIKGFLHKEIF